MARLPSVREHRLLSDVGRTLEVELVAVRVDHLRDPHAISDKGSFCRESTRGELAVDRQSVFADEVDRHTDTELCIGHVPVMSLLPELLQHQRGFAELEPAPAKLALVDPLLRHLEAESVDVEAPRRFDIVDPEEGN